MKRIEITPRENWKKESELLGFTWHTGLNPYWNESAYYEFSGQEIAQIEQATHSLNQLCYLAIEKTIENNLFADLKISDSLREPIIKSWERDDPTIFGRMDLAYEGINPPKFLEYNADTPTSLPEASLFQWYWLKAVFPENDQFNSLHDCLTEQMEWLKSEKKITELWLTTMEGSDEDWGNLIYLADTAVQSGIKINVIPIEEIGHDGNQFVDGHGKNISRLFKLYPWEWLVNEDAGQEAIDSAGLFIEPLWKLILQSKGLLPLLWKLFPDHPNLLPAYLEPRPDLISFVKKPFWSREGANITISDGQTHIETGGMYGSEGFIYQKKAPLFQSSGNYSVIGSWIVGETPAGIGVREDHSQVITNLSPFVPHIIKE